MQSKTEISWLTFSFFQNQFFFGGFYGPTDYLVGGGGWVDPTDYLDRNMPLNVCSLMWQSILDGACDIVYVQEKDCKHKIQSA